MSLLSVKVPLLWVKKGSYFGFRSPQQKVVMHARSKNISFSYNMHLFLSYLPNDYQKIRSTIHFSKPLFLPLQKRHLLAKNEFGGVQVFPGVTSCDAIYTVLGISHVFCIFSVFFFCAALIVCWWATNSFIGSSREETSYKSHQESTFEERERKGRGLSHLSLHMDLLCSPRQVLLVVVFCVLWWLLLFIKYYDSINNIQWKGQRDYYPQRTLKLMFYCEYEIELKNEYCNTCR